MQLYQIPSVTNDATRKAVYLLNAAGMAVPDGAVVGRSVLLIEASVGTLRRDRERARAITQALRKLGVYAGSGRYVVELDTRDLLKTKVKASAYCSSTESVTGALCHEVTA